MEILKSWFGFSTTEYFDAFLLPLTLTKPLIFVELPPTCHRGRNDFIFHHAPVLPIGQWSANSGSRFDICNGSLLYCTDLPSIAMSSDDATRRKCICPFHTRVVADCSICRNLLPIRHRCGVPAIVRSTPLPASATASVRWLSTRGLHIRSFAPSSECDCRAIFRVVDSASRLVNLEIRPDGIVYIDARAPSHRLRRRCRSDGGAADAESTVHASREVCDSIIQRANDKTDSPLLPIVGLIRRPSVGRIYIWLPRDWWWEPIRKNTSKNDNLPSPWSLNLFEAQIERRIKPRHRSVSDQRLLVASVRMKLINSTNGVTNWDMPIV